MDDEYYEVQEPGFWEQLDMEDEESKQKIAASVRRNRWGIA